MAKLEIEVVGYNNSINELTINGKQTKIKADKNGLRTFTFETQEKEAQLCVYKMHNYSGKAWFWWSLLYYLVSVFGIFDTRDARKCMVIDFMVTVPLEEDSKIKLTLSKFQDGGTFAEVESQNAVIVSNTQYYDKQAQNRKKKFKIVKFLLFAAFIALIVFVAYKNLPKLLEGLI